MKANRFMPYVVGIAAMVVVSCKNMTDVNPDPEVPQSPVSVLPIHNENDLPAPATDTVEMILGSQRYTLVKRTSCRDGAVGIGFEKSLTPGDYLPSLYLHFADFSAAPDISLRTGAPTWYLEMLDTAVTWQTIDAGCPARIIENTSTFFELKAIQCSLKNFKNTVFSVVSFKVRCTKE